MAKKIIQEMWKSDDGKLYETKIQALEADINYWKSLGQKWLDYTKVIEKKKRHRMSYHKRGSHQ